MIDSSASLDSMLSSRSPEAEAAVISYCRYLATRPLGEPNFELYAKILNRNIPEAADILLGRTKPASFFSLIPAGRPLIAFALSTLCSYSARELYGPIALSCLGICMRCYGPGARGMDLYRLSVNELYGIAKFLVPGDEEMESVIMDVLESIRELRGEPELANLAGRILDHALDPGKSLSAVIPAVILGPDYSS